MTPADWRELIDSYVGGRLSAASFQRRFLEAFAEAARVPGAVQDLYFTVEAYGGDPMGRGHDVSDDAGLMVAARRALMRLGPAEEAAPPPRPSAPMGAGGQADGPAPGAAPRRTARVTAGLPPGLAAGMGLGCLVLAAWMLVGLLQVFAIAEQVDRVADIGPVLATASAFVLTFVPVAGSVIAFFGAKDGWMWHPWVAAGVFLVIPAIVQIASLVAWRGGAKGRRRGY